MTATREIESRVSEKNRGVRMATPEIDPALRERITKYWQLLRSRGMMISEGAALLHAAMQTIDAELGR